MGLWLANLKDAPLQTALVRTWNDWAVETVIVEPKLAMLPSEIIYRQVYTSFQHDRSAAPAYTAMGYHNIMWGDDYPHLEGTYGHTQQTLHKLFDGVPDDAARAIPTETFEGLFHAPARP
jgi:hypothetical protein